MSVSIATMGMFNQCCGSRAVGGGAPPYRRDEEKIKPYVRVTDVEVKSIKVSQQLFKDISIKLLNEDDQEDN